jgi:hypothetical protein
MYKLLQNPCSLKIVSVLNLETGDLIPFDETNRHYQEYQAWLAEGNEPLQPDAPDIPQNIQLNI